MTEATKTRFYSVTMGVLNSSVTLFLFLMARVNADAGWTNIVVSLVGPFATIVFLMISIAWFLDALRPGVMRAFVPGGREPEGILMTTLSGTLRAPTPLPDTLNERCSALMWRWTTAPVRGLARCCRAARER